MRSNLAKYERTKCMYISTYRKLCTHGMASLRTLKYRNKISREQIVIAKSHKFEISVATGYSIIFRK